MYIFHLPYIYTHMYAYTYIIYIYKDVHIYMHTYKFMCHIVGTDINVNGFRVCMIW